jgi:hypothetical protein
VPTRSTRWLPWLLWGPDPRGPGRHWLAGPPAARGWPARAHLVTGWRRSLRGGGRQRGHRRGSGGQPPALPSGGLAAAQPRSALPDSERRPGLCGLRGSGAAGSAARRPLPDRAIPHRAIPRHPDPVAVVRQLCPAADPPPAGCPRRAGAGGPDSPWPRRWCSCWARWWMPNPCPPGTRRSGTR